jgi:hypothetical protein
MVRTFQICLVLLLAAGAARAEDADAKAEDKRLSGMSIVGNDEAPKSLVIVPWKSSGLGDSIDVWSALGDGRQPVDRDVFLRELDYYRIREGTAKAGGASAP